MSRTQPSASIGHNAHSTAQANPDYLAVNWEAGGGGSFAVIPLEERGKLPERLPLFRGHTAAVLDTDWYNHLLAISGQADAVQEPVQRLPHSLGIGRREGMTDQSAMTRHS